MKSIQFQNIFLREYTEKIIYLGEQKILLVTTHTLVCYDKEANALPQQRFLTGFARY
jgi:hypothetical protein